MADVVVACSGALLSSLIFKLKNVKGDAEGILFGEVRERSIENITDSQSAGIKEELSIFIQSFYCCDRRFSFYDRLGRLDFAKIEAMAATDIERVIGWFSYRCNTSHQISMRERVIHNRLMTSFPTIASKHFLFGLFTEQLLENSEVHSTVYTFHHCIGTSPQITKCEVVNLGQSMAPPYQHLPPTPLPPTPLPPTPTNLSTILQQHRHQFQDSSGQMLQIEAIESLYKAVIAKLTPLHKELNDSTAEMVALSREVSDLRKEVETSQSQEGNEKEKGLEMQEIFDDLVESKDNLINLGGVSNGSTMVVPMERLQPLSASQDLLCNSPDPSDRVEEYDILRPEVVTCSDKHRTVDSVSQSQELF